MFYVYILEAATTGKWYYGFTQRMEERLQEHNWNNGHFMDGKGPWTLIFKRSFYDKSEALLFEKLLKKTKNKTYLRRVYQEYFI